MSSSPRLFDPSAQIRNNPSQTLTQPSDILYHDVETGTRKLIMYALFAPDTPRIVQSSIAVAISCAIKGPKTSYGVYFAPDSALNSQGLLPGPVNSSDGKQGPEFYALSKALDSVEDEFIKTSKLVVLTDSEVLARGLAENVWEWEFNGYKDSEGEDMVDADVFKNLQRRIGKLEGGGMDVCFWLVEKKWNLEARALADAAVQ